MKKPVLIAMAILVSAFTFAQKKELKTAEKAIKNNNYAEAKAALSQAQSMMSAMDDKQKAQYHLLNAEALYAQGTANDADVSAAIDNLNQVSGGDFSTETAELRKNMENTLLTKANNLYKENNFTIAATKFDQLYNVVPADTTYLYYAAVSAVSGQDYENALKHYLKLNELGYTGQDTEYYAVDKETGEELTFDKNTRDLYVKAGTHIKPGNRMTESKSGEITKNIAFIYVNLDKNEEAIKAIKNARANSPKDVNLILTEANLHYKLGNTAEYKKLIEEAIQLDPNNIDLIYNLGVLSAEAGDKEAAKKYYNKVIEKDPTYVNALTNIASLILEEEQDIITEMNGLGTSAADNKRYDALKAKRGEVYQSAIPYLETVMEVDPTNVDVAKTLMNIFNAIGDAENSKKMKAKIEELGG